MLRIKLVRSLAGHNWRNRATIAALGLRKMHQTIEKVDTPSVRGMILKVRNMLLVETLDGEKPIADAAHLTSSSRPIRHKSMHTTTGKTVVPTKRVPSAPKVAVTAKAKPVKAKAAEPKAKVIKVAVKAEVKEKAPRKPVKKTEGEK